MLQHYSNKYMFSMTKCALITPAVILTSGLSKKGTSSLLHFYHLKNQHPPLLSNKCGRVDGLAGLYPSFPWGWDRSRKSGFCLSSLFCSSTPCNKSESGKQPMNKGRFYPQWQREDLVGRGSVAPLLNKYKVVTQRALRGIKSLR